MYHIFKCEQIKKETELGKLANSYMSQGQLVPDEVTINIVKDRLGWEDAENGVILDGFPRTIKQAEALASILQEKGKQVDIVPELVVPDQVIIDRIYLTEVHIALCIAHNLKILEEITNKPNRLWLF